MDFILLIKKIILDFNFRFYIYFKIAIKLVHKLYSLIHIIKRKRLSVFFYINSVFCK